MEVSLYLSGYTPRSPVLDHMVLCARCFESLRTVSFESVGGILSGYIVDDTRVCHQHSQTSMFFNLFL